MKHSMIKRLHTLVVAIALVAASTSVWAEEDLVYTSRWNNLAAGGYDVTSYFTEEGPVEGSKKFQTEYNGAEWLFVSQENLDAFIEDPEKYAPQYGGYCAWAVSRGNTASGDPLLWTVVEDKLYLNYNKKLNKRWHKDKENLIIAGDENWPTVLK